MTEQFNDKKILVVGGAGFVGSNLCHALMSFQPRQLIVVDNLLSAESFQLPQDQRLFFIENTITDDAVLEGLPEDLDYVFHLATYHGNQSSIHDPIADHDNNTLTSLKLFNRIKSFKNLKNVVYSSAGCTVAQKTFDTAVATTEDDSVSLYLDSPYQMSKIFGEFYGNYFSNKYGMPFVKARFQNVYGPGEILGAGQWRGTINTVWRNVTPTFIFKALQGESLPVENNGIATRDMIYVDDIVNGLLCCALNGKNGGIYNLASGVEVSILELAETINQLTGNMAPIDFKPARSWDRSGKRFGATERAKNEIGFEAKVDVREGLQKTVAWTRENMDVIQACIAKHVPHAKELLQYTGQTACA